MSKVSKHDAAMHDRIAASHAEGDRILAMGKDEYEQHRRIQETDEEHTRVCSRCKFTETKTYSPADEWYKGFNSKGWCCYLITDDKDLCPTCYTKRKAKEDFYYKWNPWFVFGGFCLGGAALIAFLAWHQCNVQMIC